MLTEIQATQESKLSHYCKMAFNCITLISELRMGYRCQSSDLTYSLASRICGSVLTLKAETWEIAGNLKVKFEITARFFQTA